MNDIHSASPNISSAPEQQHHGRIHSFLARIGVRGGGVERATVPPDALVDPFETNNFVRDAPTLEQAAKEGEVRSADVGFLDTVEAHVSAGKMATTSSTVETRHVTEAEALGKFLEFLGTAEELAQVGSVNEDRLQALLDEKDTNSPNYVFGLGVDKPSSPAAAKEWIQQSVDALRATSFLGSREFDEAARGISQYWRSFLAEDPESQIYLHRVEKGKSSGFVLEKILEQFNPSELERMHGRIVDRIELLTADPAKAKIILLDDWMMSGDQMFTRRAGIFPFRSFEEDQSEEEKKYSQTVEINLLIGDQKRLEQGSTYWASDDPVPVKAYFRAPNAVDADMMDDEHERTLSRISGVHSSADYRFSLPVSNIIKVLGVMDFPEGVTPPRHMPPLTNIVRKYHQDPVATLQDSLFAS